MPQMTTTSGQRTLLLGWRGGVAHATLNLLAGHPFGQKLAGASELFLLDADSSRPAPEPPLAAQVLPAQTILGGDDLFAILGRYAIDRVLDLGASNSLASVRACADAGADYLSTCYDPLHYRAHGPPTGPLLMRGARDLLPERRPAIARGSHLVGSGMNPGLVSSLLLSGLGRFAERAGVASARSVAELDLYAILITEIDTTATGDAPAEDVFAMSWSPDHCLSELLEPDALVMRGGEVASLGHPPTAAHYTARCGHGAIRGFVVPHEELVWLGARFPSCEMGYIYQLPTAAEAALRSAPAREAKDWKTRRLIPPRVDSEALGGSDRVGVLLCSRRHGELWLGFDTAMEEAIRWRTNATELQVASGVLAGWAQLGQVAGLHLAEELDWRRYLRDAESILGPARVVYDPDAPVRPVAGRRVA